MPIVNGSRQRQVATAPLPGVRRTAAETPLSEGVPLSQAQAGTWHAAGTLGAEVEHLGGTIAGEQIRLADDRRRQREKDIERADQVALWDTDNQLSQFVTDALYHPETGALTKKGPASFDTPEAVGEAFDQKASTIAATLGTTRQRENFQHQAARRRVDLDETLRRHVAGEIDRYEATQLQALVQNKQQEAIRNANDPSRIGAALDEAELALVQAAPRMGLSPDGLDREIGKVRTATHLGVVETLLAQNQPRQAAIYFDETRGAIDEGEAKNRIIKALEVGDDLAQAQHTADRILSQGGTLTEQRTKAKALEGKLRQNVLGILEHEASVQQAADRETEQQLYAGAYATVYQTHSTRSLDPVTITKLGSHLPALQSFADRLAKGLPVETNYTRFYALLEQAGDDPDTFMHANLLKDRGQLDDGDFKRLAELQLSMRSKGAKGEGAAKELPGFQTHNEIVKSTLFQYLKTEEKDYTPDQKAAKANLLRQLDQYVAAEQAGGRKVTNEQVQTQLDKLLQTDGGAPGSWWGLVPFNGVALRSTPAKALIDTRVDDISPTDRSALEQALRASRKPVTDQTVLDLYISIQMAGRK